MSTDPAIASRVRRGEIDRARLLAGAAELQQFETASLSAGAQHVPPRHFAGHIVEGVAK
jgi:hypothetical protein